MNSPLLIPDSTSLGPKCWLFVRSRKEQGGGESYPKKSSNGSRTFKWQKAQSFPRAIARFSWSADDFLNSERYLVLVLYEIYEYDNIISIIYIFIIYIHYIIPKCLFPPLKVTSKQGIFTKKGVKMRVRGKLSSSQHAQHALTQWGLTDIYIYISTRFHKQS